MTQLPNGPGEIEVCGTFRKHLGGMFTSAGLCIQFHYNQEPGIHFKIPVASEFQDAIVKGLRDAMAFRFPSFPAFATIWITRVESDEAESSWHAFYQSARMVVEQAHLLSQPCSTTFSPEEGGKQ